ncbi:hypothetical protein VTI28DRAFT_6370 [Corynascus sepedonium]
MRCPHSQIEKAALANFGEGAADLVKNVAKASAKHASEHPIMTAAIVGGVLFTVAPHLLVTPALNAAGFSANGVVSGSIAAGAQSSIGNVAAGSAFATLQSAGAGGAGATVVNGIIQTAGASVAGVASGAKFLSSRLKNKL